MSYGAEFGEVSGSEGLGILGGVGVGFSVDFLGVWGDFWDGNGCGMEGV